MFPQVSSVNSLINHKLLVFWKSTFLLPSTSPSNLLFPSPDMHVSLTHSPHMEPQESVLVVELPQSRFLSTRSPLPLIPLRGFNLFPHFLITCVRFPSITSMPISRLSHLSAFTFPRCVGPNNLCPPLHSVKLYVHFLCLTDIISKKHPSCIWLAFSFPLSRGVYFNLFFLPYEYLHFLHFPSLPFPLVSIILILLFLYFS